MLKKFIIIILILIFGICSAMTAEQLGLYDTYSIAPNVGDRIKYSDDSRLREVDKNKGYYVDGRGQVPEYSRIKPPHEEMIPEYPHPSETVQRFDKYYDINEKGIRRNPIMEQWVPNYDWFYSNRRANPYTKEEFVNVWCSGEKFVNGVDCIQGEYAITFVRARDWTIGTIKAPLKAKKVKKKTAIFLMVDDLGLDAEVMHHAKDWSVQFNMPMFFGTIDSYIPQSWIN